MKRRRKSTPEEIRRSCEASLRMSRKAALERIVARHADEILARVRRTYPNNQATQLAALERWARILRACDPQVADRLIAMRVSGRAA